MQDPEQNIHTPPFRFQLKLAYKLIFFALYGFTVHDTQLDPAVVITYIYINNILV